MNFKKKNILITGSTKGLGKELAIEFDKLGSNLVIVGRTKKIILKMKKALKNYKNHLFFDGDLMKEKIILISNDYFLPDLQNEISEIPLDI
jgi:2-deoxy-D-gluconate 3-dehydrogenase